MPWSFCAIAFFKLYKNPHKCFTHCSFLWFNDLMLNHQKYKKNCLWLSYRYWDIVREFSDLLCSLSWYEEKNIRCTISQSIRARHPNLAWFVHFYFVFLAVYNIIIMTVKLWLNLDCVNLYYSLRGYIMYIIKLFTHEAYTWRCIMEFIHWWYPEWYCWPWNSRSNSLISSWPGHMTLLHLLCSLVYTCTLENMKQKSMDIVEIQLTT